VTVFLVRHAHALTRGSWDGDDLERPLSPRGRRQATAIAELLGREPIERLYSSPAARCVDTVAPLADGLGLDVKTSSELLEGNAVEDALALLSAAARRRGDTVVCCHGDLVPEVLRWVARQGADMDGADRWAKGSTWVLDWKGDEVARARYVRPLEA
jgi:8-oxo-dGTP diphosphatase